MTSLRRFPAIFGVIAVPVALTAALFAGAGAQEASPTPSPTPGVQATPAVEIDCAANPAGAPSTVYSIDSAASEARYKAQEELRGRGAVTAIGKTNAIIGQILFDAKGMPMICSRFDVDLRTLQSDESRRDNYLQNNTLEAQTYPLATFILTSTEGLDKPLVDGEETTFRMVGNLTFHGVTKLITWDATVMLKGDMLTGKASTNFIMKEFDITPPKVGPVLSLDELVVLEVDLSAKKA